MLGARRHPHSSPVSAVANHLMALPAPDRVVTRSMIAGFVVGDDDGERTTSSSHGLVILGSSGLRRGSAGAVVVVASLDPETTAANPSGALSARIVPPCASTIRRQMYSPNPVPTVRRPTTAGRTCRRHDQGSSVERPGPLSCTVIVARVAQLLQAKP